VQLLTVIPSTCLDYRFLHHLHVKVTLVYTDITLHVLTVLNILHYLQLLSHNSFSCLADSFIAVTIMGAILL